MTKMINILIAALLLQSASWGTSLLASEVSEAQAEISAKKVEEEASVSLITKKEPMNEKAWYVPNFTWGDVNVNYLDWTDGTVRRGGGAYDDFWYLELEGGAGWDWGELYFFTDWENPGKGFDADKAPDDSRWVINRFSTSIFRVPRE